MHLIPRFLHLVDSLPIFGLLFLSAALFLIALGFSLGFDDR